MTIQIDFVEWCRFSWRQSSFAIFLYRVLTWSSTSYLLFFRWVYHTLDSSRNQKWVNFWRITFVSLRARARMKNICWNNIYFRYILFLRAREAIEIKKMKCDKYYGFQSWNVINTTVKCDKYYGAENCSWIMIIWLILVIIAQKYAWIKELTSKCDKYYGCFSIGPGSVKKFLVVFLTHRKQGYWGGKLREKITLQEAKCEKYYGGLATGFRPIKSHFILPWARQIALSELWTIEKITQLGEIFRPVKDEMWEILRSFFNRFVVRSRSDNKSKSAHAHVHVHMCMCIPGP